MKKLMALLIGCVATMSFAIGRADSGECSKTSHQPLPVAQEGISAANDGDVAGGSGNLYICNTGSTVGPSGTVPAPAKGHAEIGGDLSKQEGHIYVDGDSNNTSASPCTDGYFRVHLTAGPPTFSNEPNGAYKATDPKKDAATFAQDTANDCG